jgi:hypothetical protein
VPLIINIPEADSIRRLAGALTTSKSHRRVTAVGGLDFSHTVRAYFRRIPWTGRRAVTVDLMLDMSLVTVGQYFMSLDWDGTSGPVTLESDQAAQSLPVPDGLDGSDAFITPNETVSLDGFFTDYFGN